MHVAKVKLAIVYYSQTGTNYQLAQWAEEGAKASGLDVEVRLRKVRETAPREAIEQNDAWKAHVEEAKDVPEAKGDDLQWADAVIFSVPTRFGNIASQMKQFLDEQGGLWAQKELENKVVSAMSSAQNPHGGQEATILALYTSMYHWGAIIASPGYTDDSVLNAGGNPYGTSVSVDGDARMIEDEEKIKAAVMHQAKRTVTVAGWVKKGRG